MKEGMNYELGLGIRGRIEEREDYSEERGWWGRHQVETWTKTITSLLLCRTFSCCLWLGKRCRCWEKCLVNHRKAILPYT